MRTKCRATRRPVLKSTAFADRILLQFARARAHVSERKRPGEGGEGGGEGDAQHFNEVKDDRERVDGHGQPRTECDGSVVTYSPSFCSTNAFALLFSVLPLPPPSLFRSFLLCLY